MRRHAEVTDRRPGSTEGLEPDRLLQAIDELRALERERRTVPETARSHAELDRRVEAKAREVFRIAGTVDREADPGERGEPEPGRGPHH